MPDSTRLFAVNRGARAALGWATLGFLPLFGVMVAVALLGGTLLKQFSHLFGVPGQELLVGLNKKDVSLFRVLEAGSAASFSDADQAQMRQLPGVVGLFPMSYGSLPTEAEVALFGKGFKTDMVLQGVDPQWLEPPLQEAMTVWKEGDLVPMVVNSSILAIYNQAYSKGKGLPELSEAALKTPIVVVRYGAPPNQVVIKGRIVGLSPKVALGLAIPAKVLTELHQRLAASPPLITELVLSLDPDGSVDQTRSAIQKMGFVINEPGQVLQVFERFRQVVDGTLGPLLTFLAFICATILCQGWILLLVRQRFAYAALVAAGSQRLQLGAALLGEGLFWIAVHLMVGGLLGWSLANWLHQSFISEFLQQFLGEIPALGLQIEPFLKLCGNVLGFCLVLLLPAVYWVLRPVAKDSVTTAATPAKSPETL